jgi:hypothetical protein
MATKYSGITPVDADPGYARHLERRPEPVFGLVVKRVFDASVLRKRKVQDLYVFRIPDLFNSADETFIGFGIPNAYITTPDGNGSYEKLSVKSFRRAPTTIDDTHDLVQAGIQLRLKNLPVEVRERLRVSMRKIIGEYFDTCVNGCMTVMQDAGFSSGDKPLTAHYLPVDVLTTFLQNGLFVDGQRIDIDVIRTTSVPCAEKFAMKIAAAELATFQRHARRNLEGKARVSKGAAVGLFVMDIPRRTKEMIFGKACEEKHAHEVAPGLPYGGEYNQLKLSISMPSTVGVLLRLMWGSHALFSIEPQGINIDDHLPGYLDAFPQANPNFVTRMKKRVLFAPPVIWLIRKVLCPAFKEVGMLDERDLLDALRTHTDDCPNKYNIGVTGVGEDFRITIARISVGQKIADWILSKHVILTGYADKLLRKWLNKGKPEVDASTRKKMGTKFCGEGWKDVDGYINVSPNSGTYQPKEDEVIAMVCVMQLAMPHLKFRAVGIDGKPLAPLAVAMA